MATATAITVNGVTYELHYTYEEVEGFCNTELQGMAAQWAAYYEMCDYAACARVGEAMRDEEGFIAVIGYGTDEANLPRDPGWVDIEF